MDQERDQLFDAGDSRLRIIYLYQMLRQSTDETHWLSTYDIIGRMQSEHGIYMHRTTLPIDIAILRSVGVDVQEVHKRAYHFYIPEAPFTLPELRLMIDAVLSSRFITAKRSKELVQKLISLTGEHNREKLHRTVHATGKAKSENEQGYAIVDALNEAIHRNRKVSFCYFDYNRKKEHILRNDGAPYTVSPYDLIWDGDAYYLTGYCDERGEVRTFRVDRIDDIPGILPDKIVRRPKGYRVEKYTQEVFRMYATQDVTEVKLLCDEDMMRVLVDKFGPKVRTKKDGSNRFIATVKVCLSPNFYRWVFGWRGKMTIQSPEEVRQQYRQLLQEELEQYNG